MINKAINRSTINDICFDIEPTSTLDSIGQLNQSLKLLEYYRNIRVSDSHIRVRELTISGLNRKVERLRVALSSNT